MGKFIDLTGKRFGRLTAIERVGTSTNGCVVWRCSCDCGCEVSVMSASLRQGFTKSCGCYNREESSKRSYKHGMIGSRLYRIWSAMIERCSNANNSSYKSHGGRGIQVCEEWRTDFASFMKWALSSGYADNLTIDRIDNDKDYEPSNCRWITHREQQNNKRDNHLLTFNGETHNVTQWSQITGIKRTTLYNRLNVLNWSVERALTTRP